MAQSRLEPHATPDRRAFTVPELTVVIAVIAIVAAITLVTATTIRSTARTLHCQANQRQIALACVSYASSNVGILPSPRTQFKDGSGDLRIDGRDVPWSRVRWTHAWVADDVSGKYNLGTAGGQQYEMPKALTDGVLFAYLGEPKVYVSPNEPATPTNLETAGITGFPQRVRSYALNGLLGVTRPDEAGIFDTAFTATMYGVTRRIDEYNTQSLSMLKFPSRTFCSVVEDDTYSFNLNGFLVKPNEPRWYDAPAMWRPEAITFSNADGSVGAYSLANPELPKLIDDHGHSDAPESNYLQPPDSSAGFAIDWKFFRDRLNPAVIPGSISLTSEQ